MGEWGFFSPIIIIFFWSAFVYRSIVSTLDGKKLSIVFVLSYFTVIYEQRSVLCSVVAFCFASMKKKSLHFHKLILYHMVCGVDTWWYCSIHILHVSFFLLFSFWCIFHTFYELQFFPSVPPLFKWKKNVILFWFLLLLLVEWMHAFNSNVITNIFVIQLLCKMFEWTSSGLILLFCISMEIDFTLECNLCINFKWKKQ